MKTKQIHSLAYMLVNHEIDLIPQTIMNGEKRTLEAFIDAIENLYKGDNNYNDNIIEQINIIKQRIEEPPPPKPPKQKKKKEKRREDFFPFKSA